MPNGAELFQVGALVSVRVIDVGVGVLGVPSVSVGQALEEPSVSEPKSIFGTFDA
jgi:hypothetical protein